MTKKIEDVAHLLQALVDGKAIEFKRTFEDSWMESGLDKNFSLEQLLKDLSRTEYRIKKVPREVYVNYYNGKPLPNANGYLTVTDAKFWGTDGYGKVPDHVEIVRFVEVL